MTSPELKRPEVIYPESDGKPMGETDLHRKLMVDIIEAADHRFLEDPDVYVTGDLLLYYEEGDPTKVIVPDVFVVQGVEKKLRRTYKLWEEKKAPDVVVEVSSRSTQVEDKGNKKVIYENLGVREYFLFDPEGKWLRPPLQGYRLVGSVLEPVQARRTGEGALVLVSEVLGLELRAEGSVLRWVDPRTGKPLPTPRELHAVAAAERQRADAAEAELARVRAELERLRGSLPDREV
jgi:Uma2 family endonuclease